MSAAAWIQVALTAILALITGYYAWQNKRMADHNARMVDEMVRQNQLAVRPLLTAVIESRQLPTSDRWEDALIIKNIGNGPALSVRTAPIKLHENKEAPEWALSVGFDVVDVIKPGEDTIVTTQLRIGDKEDGPDRYGFLASLSPRSAKDDYRVTILYQDVDGLPHQSVVEMGKSGIRLRSHS